MRFTGVLVLAIALSACKPPGGDHTDGATAAQDTKKDTATPEQEPAPIACKVDADCPPRPCGPCTPGEVVMIEPGPAVNCAQNPCTNARSVCSPENKCVVHPDTRMVDDVHSEACQKLLVNKWYLCKGLEGSALSKCQDTIDKATASDDEDTCKAARALLEK